jgi:hypothetical protein
MHLSALCIDVISEVGRWEMSGSFKWFNAAELRRHEESLVIWRVKMDAQATMKEQLMKFSKKVKCAWFPCKCYKLSRKTSLVYQRD